MKLPEDKRHLFKEPLGKLFENTDNALEYLNSLDYDKIITVGDVVTAKLLENGFDPDLVIVDYATKRSPVEKENVRKIKEYSIPETEVKNPAGQITEDLWESIKEAETPLKIIIEGEEDLATLPSSLLASEGSVVVYGQPDEGMVIIHVTEEKKDELRDYLEVFEEE